MVNDCSSLVLGAKGESVATEYLKKKGYTVLGRNYRVKGGEVDIIARVKDTLVFVEVKARTSSRYGYPEEAVSCAKRHRLARAVRKYLLDARVSPRTYIRFDIIAIVHSAHTNTDDITHIQDIDIGEEVF